jgi:glucosylceramidase
MRKLGLLVGGGGLALLVASCGSESPTGGDSPTGGSGAIGPATGGTVGGGGTGGAAAGTGGMGAGTGGAVAGTGGMAAGSGGLVAGTGGALAGSGGLVAGTGGAIAGSGGSPGGSGGTTGGVATGGADATGGIGGTTGGVGTGGSPPVQQPALVTSGPGAYWQEAQLTPATATVTVTVDENTTYQTWLGFGGTFNEAGWDALGELTQAEIDLAIRLLFDAAEGANFAWGRLPIGASDYAMDRYTLNDTPGDYQMASFSIDRDRQRLIPYIKAALAVKPNLRLWASPWSPPAWMKDSNSIDGTDANETFTSHMLSDSQTLEALALYFARFVEEYATEGIHIEQVQPQNEPGYATRYPSCLWDAGLLGTFVGDYLGPTFESRGLDTEIWFGTLSNNDTYSGHIGGLTGAAASYTVGVGLQWNTMGHIQELTNQGYLILQTEHKCGNYPWETATFNPDSPPNDHAYAVESWGLIRDWIQAGAHVYSAWNMVLDTVGQNLDEYRAWPQNALLTVDRNSKTLTATPAYYVFRHLSYFVDPGAVRLGTNGGDALAFRNPDGSIVAIVYNSGSQAAQTTVAVGGAAYQFQVPGQGWATVNWEG